MQNLTRKSIPTKRSLVNTKIKAPTISMSSVSTKVIPSVIVGGGRWEGLCRRWAMARICLFRGESSHWRFISRDPFWSLRGMMILKPPHAPDKWDAGAMALK